MSNTPICYCAAGSETFVIAVPNKPVTVSVTVQVMDNVLTFPDVAISCPVAPGKGAVPPEFVVVVAEFSVTVFPLLLLTVLKVISMICPAKSVVNGSVMATKAAAAGIVNATGVPAEVPVGKFTVRSGGAVTVIVLPVICTGAKPSRLADFAITVIVCVPLNGGGEKAICIVPELFVFFVPKSKT